MTTLSIRKPKPITTKRPVANPVVNVDNTTGIELPPADPVVDVMGGDQDYWDKKLGRGRYSKDRYSGSKLDDLKKQFGTSYDSTHQYTREGNVWVDKGPIVTTPTPTPIIKPDLPSSKDKITGEFKPVSYFGGIKIGTVSSNNPYSKYINQDLTTMMKATDSIINPIASKYGFEQGWQDKMTPEEKQQVTWAQEIVKNHPNNQQYTIQPVLPPSKKIIGEDVKKPVVDPKLPPLNDTVWKEFLAKGYTPQQIVDLALKQYGKDDPKYLAILAKSGLGPVAPVTTPTPNPTITTHEALPPEDVRKLKLPENIGGPAKPGLKPGIPDKIDDRSKNITQQVTTPTPTPPEVNPATGSITTTPLTPSTPNTPGYSFAPVSSDNVHVETFNGTLNSAEDNATTYGDILEDINTIEGKAKSDTIFESNKGKKERATLQELELDRIKAEADLNAANRRKDADDIFQRQQKLAAINSNIAEAQAGSSGLQMSQGAMTDIRNDIISKYGTNIANAEQFKLTTNMTIDQALKDTGIQIFDKQSVIDTFRNALTDAEFAPILTALTASAQGKKDAAKDVYDMYKKYVDMKAAEEYVRVMAQESRKAKDKEWFDASNPEKFSLLKAYGGDAILPYMDVVGDLLKDPAYAGQNMDFFIAKLAKVARLDANTLQLIMQNMAMMGAAGKPAGIQSILDLTDQLANAAGQAGFQTNQGGADSIPGAPGELPTEKPTSEGIKSGDTPKPGEEPATPGNKTPTQKRLDELIGNIIDGVTNDANIKNDLESGDWISFMVHYDMTNPGEAAAVKAWFEKNKGKPFIGGSGASGYTGYTGTSGKPNVSGYSGTSGNIGTSGYSGTSGTKQPPKPVGPNGFTNEAHVAYYNGLSTEDKALLDKYYALSTLPAGDERWNDITKYMTGNNPWGYAPGANLTLYNTLNTTQRKAVDLAYRQEVGLPFGQSRFDKALQVVGIPKQSPAPVTNTYGLSTLDLTSLDAQRASSLPNAITTIQTAINSGKYTGTNLTKLQNSLLYLKQFNTSTTGTVSPITIQPETGTNPPPVTSLSPGEGTSSPKNKAVTMPTIPAVQSSWNLSGWEFADPVNGWTKQPILTIDGRNYTFESPAEYYNALLQIKATGATGSIDRVISDLQPHIGTPWKGVTYNVNNPNIQTYTPPPGNTNTNTNTGTTTPTPTAPTISDSVWQSYLAKGLTKQQIIAGALKQYGASDSRYIAIVNYANTH